MNRRPRRTAAALLLAAALLAGAGCSEPEAVPTFRVERATVVHTVTAEGTLEAATSTPISVPTSRRGGVRIAWLAPPGSRVEDGEVVVRFDGQDMEELLLEGEGDLASTRLKSDKAVLESDTKIGEVDTDYEKAGYEVEFVHRFQKVDSEVFSRREIAESLIDGELAEFKQENATLSRETQRDLARTELEILAIQQGQARQKIDEARSGLEELEVRAPHAGIFNLKASWQGVPEVGTQMWPGAQIGEIPDLSEIQAEVFVLEADAGGLEVGQRAEVVIEAYPERPLSGEVTRVDKVAKPRFRGSPVQYFGITLAFPATDPAIMKPGQRVRATLFLEEHQDSLAVPRQAVFEEEGRRLVYVREGGGFAPRAVKVGASTMGRHIVEEGLAEGEVIALSRPAAAAELPELAAAEGPAEEGDDA